MEKVILKVSKKVGKALGDYNMLQNNDNVLVAVSGGKDSLTLVDILNEKKSSLPIKFNLFSVVVDFGFYKDEDVKKLKDYFESLKINYYIIKKKISESKRFNCFWCSWNRRKEIFLLAKKLNCKKIAFGHNLDDIVVTFLMNLFYHGEISTMPSKLEMFKGEIILIRPLVYVTSDETKEYSIVKKLPVLDSKCLLSNGENLQRRKYLENLVKQLEVLYPNIKMNIFNCLKKIKKEYLV